MLKTIVVPALLVSAIAFTGCKKKDGGGESAGGGEAKAAEPAAAPSKPVFKKIASMNLEVEVDEKTKVEDNTATAGFPSATLYFEDGTPTTFIFGATGDLNESLSLKATYDADKAAAQHYTDNFKAFSKDEKTANGWLLEYEGASNIDKSPIFGISLRTVIGPMTIECSTNADSDAARAKTLKVCQSIRAAK